MEKIFKLPKSVVLKIAAGEVVERPSAAIKELIENSLDAGASEIKVEIDANALKSLKITDNGHGVDKSDFSLLCKRFATSKIKSYGDIENVATFGFRGEALASISNVSKLSVISKIAQNRFAFRASFIEGVLAKPPEMCAGSNGTSILVENLFYNVPLRQRIFHTALFEEKRRCLEVVKKYAINNPKVDFVYKKQKSNVNDLCSPLAKKVAPDSLSMIRLFYGKAVSSNLKMVFGSNYNSPHKFEFEGYASTPLLKLGKVNHIIFVNRRLVTWKRLSSEVQALYKGLVHKKFKSFLYISLSVDSSQVDVNVHPQKEEVLVLGEDIIIKAITTDIKSKILCGNPYQAPPDTASVVIKTISSPTNNKTVKLPKSFKSVKENNTTDFRPRNILSDFYIKKIDHSETSSAPNDIYPKDQIRVEKRKSFEGIIKAHYEFPKKRLLEAPKSKKTLSTPLKSIAFLLSQIKTQRCEKMCQMFKNLSLLGRINNRLSLVQHMKKLLILDVHIVLRETVKQRVLLNFGELPYFAVEPVECIGGFVESFVLSHGYVTDKETAENIGKNCMLFLSARRKMLDEHFSVKIDSHGKLQAVPDIFPGVEPNIERLGAVFIKMASDVNWAEEKSCFGEVAELLSLMYFDFVESDEKIEVDGDEEDESYVDLKNILFPKMRSISFPKKFWDLGVFEELSSVDKFYSSFERC